MSARPDVGWRSWPRSGWCHLEGHGLRLGLCLLLLAGSPLPGRAQSADMEAAPPSWSQLGADQRAILAPFATQWSTVPAAEQQAWLALAALFPRMSDAERRRAERRIREWAALTPEQREIARNNYRLARELSAQERLSTWKLYETMTPEQRQVLREAGRTSNTAAGHAGAPTGLAKEAAQPIPRAAVGRAPDGTATGMATGGGAEGAARGEAAGGAVGAAAAGRAEAGAAVTVPAASLAPAPKR